MKKLIVLGSLNMDMSIETDRIPLQGETIHGKGFLMNTGGKGGNQAVAAAKANTFTYLIGKVGDDALGEQVLKDLALYGVHTDYVLTSEKESTGLAMIVRCNHDNRIMLHAGANYDITIDEVKDSLQSIAESSDLFLSQLENPYPIVKQALSYAKELGLTTILNPAPAQKLEDEVYQTLDWIVVNESECEILSGIYPDETHYKQALQWFLEKGCNVIITLGEHGCIACTKDKQYRMPANKVEVLDTTGAGDTFIGAFCKCLCDDCDITYALKYASCAASLTVSRYGAQCAIPTNEEINEFMLDIS